MRKIFQFIRNFVEKSASHWILSFFQGSAVPVIVSDQGGKVDKWDCTNHHLIVNLWNYHLWHLCQIHIIPIQNISIAVEIHQNAEIQSHKYQYTNKFKIFPVPCSHWCSCRCLDQRSSAWDGICQDERWPCWPVTMLFPTFNNIFLLCSQSLSKASCLTTSLTTCAPRNFTQSLLRGAR